MDRKRLFSIVLATAGIIVAFYLLTFALVPWLNSDAVQHTVESLGIFGPLALIGYTVLAHVIAPLFGSVGFLAGVASFGIAKTVFYIYLGSIVSAVINFWISRRFGRPAVARLVGTKTMNKIDEIVDVAGLPMLTVLRLFGVAVFEETSYAAGLTNMRFRSYMAITILANIPPHLAIALVFNNTDFSLGGNIVLFIAVLVLFGIASTWLVHTLLRKKNATARTAILEKSPDC